jgi:hypothetical protein
MIDLQGLTASVELRAEGVSCVRRRDAHRWGGGEKAKQNNRGTDDDDLDTLWSLSFCRM